MYILLKSRTKNTHYRWMNQPSRFTILCDCQHHTRLLLRQLLSIHFLFSSFELDKLLLLDFFPHRCHHCWRIRVCGSVFFLLTRRRLHHHSVQRFSQVDRSRALLRINARNNLVGSMQVTCLYE